MAHEPQEDWVGENAPNEDWARDFTPLQINLDGDNAWPELRDKEFGAGAVTHVCVLPDGTSGGKPSVAIRGKLEDGSEVVLQTTWNLLYSAARAIEARYGGARD